MQLECSSNDYINGIYTAAAQANQALAENDGNVDDAVDYLFTQDRVNKGTKVPVLMKAEDASEATDEDALVVTDLVTEASTPNSIISCHCHCPKGSESNR